MRIFKDRDGSRPLERFERAIRIAALVVAVILLASAIFSSWYTLDAKRGEHAVIQRFGRYTATVTEPGIHFKLPFGVDIVTVERVQEVRRVEVGFRSANRPETRSLFSGPATESEEEHSIVITRDQNLVDAEFVVQYEISDIQKYLFRAAQPGWTVSQAAKAVIREVIANRIIDDILTSARDAMQQEAMDLLQKLLDFYDLGVRVKGVQFQDIHAPDPVIPAFNDVQKAKEEKETAINEGKRTANTVIPKAEGEAQRTVTQAEGYKIRRISEAQGDAARFQALHESYRRDAALTRRQLYLQVMADVLPGIPKTIIEGDPGSILLPLDDFKGDVKKGRQP